ncbi:MAG: hypothetical protein IPL65_17885 [Lewinellaceae bacterium]|nr:hypothetical protein [Lewinellaceae bacterium]
MLHQNGCLSVSKIQSLFEDLFGGRINEATIQECQRTAYERLEIEKPIFSSKYNNPSAFTPMKPVCVVLGIVLAA